MYEPRNPEINAQFVEAGGLKSWGCFALLLIALVLIIFFVLVHVILNFIIRDPLAWWISSVFLAVAIAGVVVLWIRNRQRQKRVLEQIWQKAIEQSASSSNSERNV